MAQHSKYNTAASGGGGAVYGLGLIGALVYYIQHSDGILGFFVGIFQAIFWPAFVIYDLLGFLAR